MAQLRAAISTIFDPVLSAADLHTARGAMKVVGSEGAEAMTADLPRSGAGVHLYHAAAGMTSGRVFLTAAGATDPTSLPGDIWITY